MQVADLKTLTNRVTHMHPPFVTRIKYAYMDFRFDYRARKSSLKGKTEAFILDSFKKAGADKEKASLFLKNFKDYQYAARAMERIGWTPEAVEAALKARDDSALAFLKSYESEDAPRVLPYDKHVVLETEKLDSLSKVSRTGLSDSDYPALLKEAYDNDKSILLDALSELGAGTAQALYQLAKKRADSFSKWAKVPLAGKIISHLNSDAKFLSDFLKKALDSLNPPAN